MKIENSIKTTGSVSESKARPAREAASSPKAASGPQVELSNLASNLQKLEQAVANTPVVDSGKVNEIKDAIAQGKFSVSPEKVADGLLSSVRQMLAAQPRSA